MMNAEQFSVFRPFFLGTVAPDRANAAYASGTGGPQRRSRLDLCV